jgi:ribA/ribD-fused uncharacterized protein
MRVMALLLDVDAVQRALQAGARLDYRFFWGHRPRRDGALSDACFSQWWPARFTVDGQDYLHAEQFMMAHKAQLFGDDEMRARILATPEPAAVKALGREVRGFDEAAWSAARFDLVTRGNVAKFGQEPQLRAYLLATNDAVLVEASPTDRVWGIGLAAEHEHAQQPARWRGLNLLGFALMRARAILRGDLPPLQP